LFVSSFIRWLLLPIAVLITPVLHAEPLTLEAAWDIAARNNPDLHRLIANQNIPAGEFKDASAPLYYNPTVNLETRTRRIAQTGASDPYRGEYGIGISQTFEIAGQQTFRRQAAEESKTAIYQDIAEEYRFLHAQLEEQFISVLTVQKRIEVEQRILKLIEQNTSLTSKRVSAGEDSLLDGNLAIVDAERARNQLISLNEQLLGARNQLAATLQLNANDFPEVTGALTPNVTQYTLQDLFNRLDSRPGIQALITKEASARSRLELQKSMRYPDLTVSLINTTEASLAGSDNISSIGVSLPLPIFRRNAAGIGRATAELTQSEINKTSGTRNAKATVEAAWLRRENIKDRVRRLNSEVYPRLEENLTLSRKAFENGEIGLPQLLIVQRQVVDAQRDIIDAQKELRLVQIELEYISGWLTPTPPAHQK
jgi:outer membrane protein, heavy metal efflux system